ncbi:phosphopantetheine binding protein [Plasticicumulans lactativorans]|uniref:Phosphopantetheine binding protein n=1 Tax=Plasticicumulans lactativorans TaxID=1133106 RepID=A0A4R2LNG4_9GAMM|nr:phosphopantetheine-binding protein [Plasticicumulans lactativorans]TCO80995.1 phosphopantetheine binding protein [Plasticicumulans lactativorans]
MATFDDVRTLIGDVLQLGERTAQIVPDTVLLGGIPEFDSMAVVSLIAAIEDTFGVTVDDDEISADIFETAGTLHAFVTRIAD